MKKYHVKNEQFLLYPHSIQEKICEKLRWAITRSGVKKFTPGKSEINLRVDAKGHVYFSGMSDKGASIKNQKLGCPYRSEIKAICDMFQVKVGDVAKVHAGVMIEEKISKNCCLYVSEIKKGWIKGALLTRNKKQCLVTLQLGEAIKIGPSRLKKLDKH